MVTKHKRGQICTYAVRSETGGVLVILVMWLLLNTHHFVVFCRCEVKVLCVSAPWFVVNSSCDRELINLWNFVCKIAVHIMCYTRIP